MLIFGFIIACTVLIICILKYLDTGSNLETKPKLTPEKLASIIKIEYHHSLPIETIAKNILEQIKQYEL